MSSKFTENRVSSKFYVKTDYVPERVRNRLTPGKKYLARRSLEYGNCATILDDAGWMCLIRPISCAYLDHRPWTVIDMDAENPKEPPAATIPGDSAERKATPLYSGCIALFPLALAAVARVMQYGANKHNDGNIGWNRPASADHKDCIARHLADSGAIDPESGELADTHLAVRALMNLQLAEEKRLGIKVEDE